MQTFCPQRSDVLAARPRCVVAVADGKAPADGSLPPDVEGPFGGEAVTAVPVGNRVGGAPALDERSSREMVGLAHPGGKPRPVRAERA
jgi:hypothetical protein